MVSSWLVGALLLGSFAAAIEPNWENDKPITGPFVFEELPDSHDNPDERGKPREHFNDTAVFNPVNFHVNMKGHVVSLVDTILVYYDAVQFSSIAVAVTDDNDNVLASCTNVETFVEFVRFPLRSCVNSIFDTAGTYWWRITGTRRSGGAPLVDYQQIIIYRMPKRPWPFENDGGGWPPSQPNVVGNLVENYQSFSGQASAYWHEGLDIRATLEGTHAQPLYSPVAGRVVNIVRYQSSDLYWSVMVEDEFGFIWQFHHLHPQTFTVRIGDTIPQGHMIGRVARWPASHNGALYHHVHMNVVRPHPSWTRIPNPYVDGWQYFNAYEFFDNGGFRGGRQPTSDGVMYFLRPRTNTAFAATSDATRPVVDGVVDIVMRWESQFAPTNNMPGQPYPNGLFEVGYSVEPVLKNTNMTKLVNGFQVGQVPRHPLLQANKLPNEWPFNLPDLRTAAANAMLRRVYKQSFSLRGRTFQSVFTYTQRIMFYTITAACRGQPDVEFGGWNTAATIPGTTTPRFPNGDYRVTGYACDWFGNCATREHTITVDN